MSSVAIRQNGTTAAANNGGALMESVLIKGDLSKLTPQERSSYYLRVCESVGLNPLTKPFEYITLNGKLTLYALRNCTDQLRTVHNVSVEELAESERDGVFIVTAKVKNGAGRTDIAKGAVNIANLKGEALANAMMKAETKAKRRATLSLCGLGFLDETEVEDIPAAAKRPAPVAAPAIAAPLPPHDEQTDEVIDDGIPAFLRRPGVVPVPAKDGKSDWIAFGQAYIAVVKTAPNLDAAEEWEAANRANMDAMRQEAPKVYDRMAAAVAMHRKTLAPQGLPENVLDAG